MPATGAAACLPLFLFVFESMNAAITAKEIADVLRGIRGEGRV